MKNAIITLSLTIFGTAMASRIEVISVREPNAQDKTRYAVLASKDLDGIATHSFRELSLLGIIQSAEAPRSMQAFLSNVRLKASLMDSNEPSLLYGRLPNGNQIRVSLERQNHTAVDRPKGTILPEACGKLENGTRVCLESAQAVQLK